MTLFVTLVAILAALVAIFYGFVVQPTRIIENWLSSLSNGEPLPLKPRVGWKYWLYPIHSECLALEKTLQSAGKGSDEAQQRIEHVEFMQHFILGSLIEGILVVNRERRITLVNSEFLHLFRLHESPLNQTLVDVMEDEKLDAMVAESLIEGKVVTGRISKMLNAEGGRPPVFEVSVVPVNGDGHPPHSAVVIFLPPPDRPRMVQILKRHSEKIHRLASEWTMRGRTHVQTATLDLPEKSPSPDAQPDQAEPPVSFTSTKDSCADR